LTAMRYILEAVKSAAKNPDSGKLDASIQEARDLASEIISDLREISLDLRPTMLDDLGLAPTLEWLTTQFRKRYEIDTELEVQVEEKALPLEVSTTVYRIIQEALGNVAKHAQANSVRIQIVANEEMLEAFIKDDGVGFENSALVSAQTQQGCSGVLNMKERVSFLGGKFRLDTKIGEGTTIKFSVPIHQPQRVKT